LHEYLSHLRYSSSYLPPHLGGNLLRDAGAHHGVDTDAHIDEQVWPKRAASHLGEGWGSG
jgi:hypothetical protein